MLHFGTPVLTDKLLSFAAVITFHRPEWAVPHLHLIEHVTLGHDKMEVARKKTDQWSLVSTAIL